MGSPSLSAAGEGNPAAGARAGEERGRAGRKQQQVHHDAGSLVPCPSTVSWCVRCRPPVRPRARRARPPGVRAARRAMASRTACRRSGTVP